MYLQATGFLWAHGLNSLVSFRDAIVEVCLHFPALAELGLAYEHIKILPRDEVMDEPDFKDHFTG